MKKYLLIGLVAALLLAGCGNTTVDTEPTAEPTVESTVETTIPTEPLPSYYVENSLMERGTGGAVKLYELDGNVTGISMLGENLLVCLDGSRLCLLDPVTLKTIRSRDLEMKLDWKDESLVITDTGLAYYDEIDRMYVTLDTNLLSVSTYVIEADMLSRPVITRNFERICYATEEGLEVMNLSDGTTRRIREEHQRIEAVNGLIFDDTILYYTRLAADGSSEVCFVNTADGSLRTAAALQGSIRAYDNGVACVMELDHALGQSRWLLVGQRGSALQRLASRHIWDDALLLSDGRAVLQSVSSVGLTLYCYDLESGLLLCYATLPEQHELLKFGAGNGAEIWLADGTGNGAFCWDISVDSWEGASSELVDYASLSSGDAEQMEQVERYAQILSDRFDVTIRFEETNNRTDGVDYSGLADVRPEQYNTALEALKLVLEKLPEGLMARIGKGADSGRVEICLVDDYDPVMNTTEATGSIDVSDGDLVIRVSMCPDMTKIFLHELFHLMEVRIRTLSDGFKDWTDCNPRGFEYLNSFEMVQSGAMDASAYLQWGGNYFVDAYAMVSQREDRAQTFLYAVLEGEGNRFLSDTMQEKLTQISKLLRKYFAIDETVTPVWEQYLETE